MELKEIAIYAPHAQALAEHVRYLRSLGVPFDPCAGDPRIERQPDGGAYLIVVVTPGIEQRLRRADVDFAVRQDLASIPDPRTYVSKTNRFEARLDRLRTK